MIRAYHTRESVAATVTQVLAPDGLDQADLEAVIEDSLAGAPAAKTAWPLSTSQENITAALADIDVPAIVISGEHDRVDPPEVLRRDLLPLLPGAQFHVLPQVGHLSPYEAPDAVANLVRAFAMSLTDDGIVSPSGHAVMKRECRFCGLSPEVAAGMRLGRSHAGIGPLMQSGPHRTGDA
jgi:hypothetical protein